MKALRTIQVLVKIARVICIIIFVCGIIGAVGCGLTLILMPLMQSLDLGEDLSIEALLAENGVTLAEAYASLSIALVSCILCIVLYKYTQKFFEKELELGTPFNMDIVKGMRKVALFHIIASLSISFISGLVLGIVAGIEGTQLNYEFDVFYTVGFGLFLLVISLFCEAGLDKAEPAPHDEVHELFEEKIDVLDE